MTGQARRPSDILKSQVAIWRARRKLSAQALANRISEIGGSLNRVAISKIENGNRGVTLDEWLQLAHALAVPPPLLFLDLATGAEVRIADGVVIHPWLAWEWVTGVHPPVVTNRGTWRAGEFGDANHVIELYRFEAKAARAVQDATTKVRRAEFVGDAQSAQEARSRYAEALAELSRCFNDMINNDVRPPAVTPTWAEDMRALGVLRYPDRLEIFAEEAHDGER